MVHEEITLIGDDATIEACTFGEEKTGDGAKTLDELAGGAAASGAGAGYWLVTAKAASGSFFGDLDVNDVYPDADGTEVLVAGDKAKLITSTPFLDASAWSVGFTADEVAITLLRHRVKKYRKGKADADGSINGVYTLGVSGEAGGILNQFLKIVRKDSSGSISVSSVNSHPIFIKGVIRDTDTAGTTYAFVWGQIELFGVNLGAEQGSAQEYDSKFRFTGNDPVYYEIEIPA